MSQAEEHVDRPPFVELALTASERTQIEAQLSVAFGLTADAARAWVDTTAARGACFGRVERGGVIAASYAAETLTLARGDERLTAVMLQSCYVHPDFRGKGYGLVPGDVTALRRRFAADAVVLTLFDDGLVPYWRRRGFEVVQRAELVNLSEYLRRAARVFSPALSDAAVAAKLAENVADGATVAGVAGAGGRGGRLLFVRSPGEDVVEELIVRPAEDSRSPLDGDGAELGIQVRLKTVMASPGDLELICAIDL
jgi:GNAT superfamily N-acetyltransferase